MMVVSLLISSTVRVDVYTPITLIHAYEQKVFSCKACMYLEYIYIYIYRMKQARITASRESACR